MGQDKALLEIDGETLVARGLRQLKEVCAEVAICGGEIELARFGRVIQDSTTDLGPLAGIVAALEQSCLEWNLFCPVDVPFVPPEAWRALLACAGQGGTEAVLARVGGQVQPLCGVYRCSTVTGLRAQLDLGKLKVTAAVQSAGSVSWVDFDSPDQQAWFRNLNTPEEFNLFAHPKRQQRPT